ncbi:hypothetical protein LNP04_18330 [Chryseobacterium sp. C-71]|uniref:hypothetical protein n=1 Tax=Chryseobacterium sp. C-71 TaxID=2893882 RepID=UPI001E2D63D3|nr:hypothetical protein [Chryseobacterium sp. C-71]UFH31901.1 hypothetical protein LNP04_18330 [Chryseobacterium sp. C-71]
MAIDQPIDFSVPESTVMLAVYLVVPEAENTIGEFSLYKQLLFFFILKGFTSTLSQ